MRKVFKKHIHQERKSSDRMKEKGLLVFSPLSFYFLSSFFLSLSLLLSENFLLWTEKENVKEEKGKRGKREERKREYVRKVCSEKHSSMNK